MDLEDADLGWLLLDKLANDSSKSTCVFADILTSSGCIIDLWTCPMPGHSGLSNSCDSNQMKTSLRKDRHQEGQKGETDETRDHSSQLGRLCKKWDKV